MSRYIDAEALLESVQSKRLIFEESTPVEECIAEQVSVFEETIEEAPTADVVEIRHAYWKETTHITESKRGREIHSKLYNCSNCDAPNGRKKSSYCHWCGAKMDGERRDGNE